MYKLQILCITQIKFNINYESKTDNCEKLLTWQMKIFAVKNNLVQSRGFKTVEYEIFFFFSP